MISKNKIIYLLEEIIKKNKFIKDIWIYGSYKDEISDLDLIVVYNNKIKNIKFPKLVENKLYGGTIIYIPLKNSKNIFLFEKLKIFSIKNKKYLKDTIPKKYVIYRALTSFIEKYYERRLKYKKVKNYNFTKNDIRNIKTILYSYDAFYTFCRLKKIKIKKKNHLRKYMHLRSKFVDKKINKKVFTNFIKDLKKFDKLFFKKSYFILENIYKKINFVSFKYNFTKNVKFIYNEKSNINLNNVPKILGVIYSFYASCDFKISKKIAKDFKGIGKLNFNNLSKNFQNYLMKKIIFLNTSYIDLKKAKLKKGMYRLTWYL